MGSKESTIVIVTNYYMPTVGGITTYVQSLARELEKRGHDVRISAFPAWLSRREDNIGSKAAHRIVHEIVASVFVMVVLCRILRLRLAGKSVVVHSQSASYCLEAGVLARLFGAKAVHTFHSPIEKCTMKLGCLLPFANALVCVSEEHRAQYIEKCGISPDTAIIPGGVDCEFFRPVSPSEKEKVITSLARAIGSDVPSRPIVLFVGRVIREKGAEVLLEAAKRVTKEFPGAEFIVIGPLDQTAIQREFVGNLKLRIEKDTHYHLIGALDQNNLRRAYQAGDIFVCPVLWEEASGLVVVEAMASGLPVIASRIGGLKSRVVDGISGRLVEPGDPGQLAEAIMDYLRNPARMLEAGIESRKLAVAKYSIESMTSACEAIYQKVTAT